RIAMNPGFEPGRAPRSRSAAVGPDSEAGGNWASVFKLRMNGLGAEFISGDPRRNAFKTRKSSDLGRERLGHSVVCDVPTKCVEINLRRMELDRTRRKQSPRVIDEAQAPQGRGLELETRPKAERFQKTDRLVEQRDGAPAACSLSRAAAHDVKTS